MLIVLKLGGSVIASPMNSKLMDEYAKLLEEVAREHRIVVVVGGGSLARDFIRVGQDLGLSEKAQDLVAIQISRIYALLLTLRIGREDSANVPTSVNQALSQLKESRIVVMGGLRPGMTTDTVAALVCQKLKAQLLIKATDQDGIYNKDPRAYKNAVKIDAMTYPDLAELFEQSKHQAGIHQILDPIAVKILRQLSIKTVVVNGYSPENVQNAIQGKRVGTIIRGNAK